MRRTAGVLAVSGVLLAGWTVLRAQTAPPTAPAQSDIMPALLEEVRGLRAALEQMTSAGPRVQLALGRLQLQEQRLNAVIKRLDDARGRLGETQRQQADVQRQLEGLDLALKEPGRRVSGYSPPGETPSPSIEELEEIRDDHRRRLARLNTEVQRLTAEESTYATEVANEQARWTDFNQRLEDLERALRPLKF
jgi:chromosome segregation ATPase